MMLNIPNMKALGLVVSNKKLFESCIKKIFFDPVTYLCNQSEPIEKTLSTFIIFVPVFPDTIFINSSACNGWINISILCRNF